MLRYVMDLLEMHSTSWGFNFERIDSSLKCIDVYEGSLAAGRKISSQFYSIQLQQISLKCYVISNFISFWNSIFIILFYFNFFGRCRIIDSTTRVKMQKLTLRLMHLRNTVRFRIENRNCIFQMLFKLWNCCVWTNLNISMFSLLQFN